MCDTPGLLNLSLKKGRINLVRINPPNPGAEGTMSLLDRSLRRVEEAGTGKDKH